LEAARRAVPPSIGRSFAAATGTAAGVVVGSALQSWLHFLAAPLPPLTLLMPASAVFAVTTGWWFAVDRAGSRQRVMIVGTSGSAADAAARRAAAHSALSQILGDVDADDA